ncbi:MAG TPA: TrmH family RNA methyltransferase [Candidatus Angelobacter sp.]|nr:TrmH family RNA methyltransferase [Candidatus Angelobacter sp.]
MLVSTRNPLNIGAAARAMSNLGFLRLRVVNPYEVSFREARSAVGAASLLASAEEYSSVAEAVADCSLVIGTTAAGNRELHQPLRLLQDTAPLIRKHLRSGDDVALLFGSEKRGLTNDDLSHCQWLMHIPTRDEHVSMNLGQAVAVCLYELARTTGFAGNRPRITAPATTRQLKPAPAGELERITEMLIEALRASGYLEARPVASKEEKIRRMVRRLELSSADAEIWLGMLRQMLWKMKPPDHGQ